MYAPVVHRLDAYAVEVPDAARAYMAAVMASKAWKRWSAEAAAEPAHWIHRATTPTDDAPSSARHTYPSFRMHG